MQDSIVDLALALGLPHDQLTIGVPAHGILYKLANVSQTTPGSPAIPWNYNDAIISHTKVRLSLQLEDEEQAAVFKLLTDKLAHIIL